MCNHIISQSTNGSGC